MHTAHLKGFNRVKKSQSLRFLISTKNRPEGLIGKVYAFFGKGQGKEKPP